MVIKTTQDVWDSDLSQAHRLVVLAILQFKTKDADMIAHYTGYSVRLVQRILSELDANGVVVEGTP